MADTSAAPGPVRPFFRKLGLVAGPLMILGGVGFLGLSVESLIVDGSQNWWANNRDFVGTAGGCLWLGYMILRAARSGKDPLVPEED